VFVEFKEIRKMMSIDQAIDKLIGIEGGYSNNPNDSGGETIWGITIATARRYGYNGPMKSMSKAAAIVIYRARYVVDPGFDKVWDVSSKIGYELFDTGVNVGPSIPSKWLQENLNIFNRQGKDYPDIAEDGDIGPGTIRALQAFIQKRGAAGEAQLLKVLNADQTIFYKNLAQRRPKDEEFFFGWIANRVVI
jgi:lysozyme family protein